MIGVQSIHRNVVCDFRETEISFITFSSHRKGKRWDEIFSPQSVDIHVYSPPRTLFENEQSQTERSPLCWSSALWEWNNCFSHISSYCNEILAVPDTEWQITPRFNHASVGFSGGDGGAGGGDAGRGGRGSVGFCLKSVPLPSRHINHHSIIFSPFN